MKKLLFVIALTVFVAAPASATESYQDLWWDPSQSGMGWTVFQQGDTVVVAWYHYDAGGDPTFLLMTGTLANGVVSGDLVRSFGPLPGSGFDPAIVTTSSVGSATLQFQSSNSATFSYQFDRLSGSVSLQRFGFSTQALSGSWAFSMSYDLSNCSDPADNGPERDSGTATITRSGNTLTMALAYDDGTQCDFDASLADQGAISQGSGSYQCNDGTTGSLVLSDIQAQPSTVSLDFTAVDSGPVSTCTAQGRFGAVKHD